MLVRARDADHADRLVHRQRDAAQRHLMHLAVVLVGPRAVREQPLARTPRLPPRRRRPVSALDARANSSRARREILGDVVEDLRASCGRSPCSSPPTPRAPPRPRCGCPSDCPRPPRRAARPSAPAMRMRVAGVGARLLAADEQLRRAIDERRAAIRIVELRGAPDRRATVRAASPRVRRLRGATGREIVRSRRRDRASGTPTSPRARPRARTRSRDSRRIPPRRRTGSSS